MCLAAAESRSSAIITLARVLVQRLDSAPKRRGDRQPNEQSGEIGRAPAPMAQKRDERPIDLFHGFSITPALSRTCRSKSRRQSRALRHHQESAARRGDDVERKLHEVVGSCFVEVAGGLIRQQETRTNGERPPDGGALLLAAGKLFGIALQKIFQPEAMDQLLLPDRIKAAGEARLKRDIGADRETGDQVELLEHDGQGLAPQRSASEVGKPGHLGVVHENLAACGVVESRDEMQERALAAAGFSHQGDARAGLEREIDALQDGDATLRRQIALLQADDAQHGRTGLARRIAASFGSGCVIHGRVAFH